MDLPFLCINAPVLVLSSLGFNPYSNGSSFFIPLSERGDIILYIRFNPYSDGSSFFISPVDSYVSIDYEFQSLF